jgi:hypothetical protein
MMFVDRYLRRKFRSITGGWTPGGTPAMESGTDGDVGSGQDGSERGRKSRTMPIGRG